MKSIVSITMALLYCSFGIANPVMPPPELLISEIYFDSSDWKIEMVVGFADNLNNISIVTSSGESFFKQGIDVEEGEIIIVTEDSLQIPLAINRNGDFINMIEYDNEYTLWELLWFQDISFGNYPGAVCSSPYEGESIVLQHFELLSPGYEDKDFYWPVKEREPSPGSNPFICSSRDSVSGYIFDKFSDPVKSAEIRYCAELELWCASPDLPQIVADDYGYFENAMMFSKFYSAQVILGDSLISNVSFNVEFDSSNSYIFELKDYVYTGIDLVELENSVFLTNYPNPVENQTIISVDIPQNVRFKNAVIKIFNINGKIVDIIPLVYNSGNVYDITWDRSNNIPDGNYFYNLDINYKKVASSRMMLLK